MVEHAIPELQAQQMNVEQASDGSVIQSFSIHTSAQEAQQAIDLAVKNNDAKCAGRPDTGLPCSLHLKQVQR